MIDTISVWSRHQINRKAKEKRHLNLLFPSPSLPAEPYSSRPQLQYFVGIKAKGRISKRVFQENKGRQIFRKTNISYPQIRTRTCAYQGVRNVRFSENLVCFVFLKNPFWDLSFCLITDDSSSTQRTERERKVKPLGLYYSYSNLKWHFFFNKCHQWFTDIYTRH